MQLTKIHVSEQWKEAAERAVGRGGPVLVLGDVDTGKTTCARYLLARFIDDRGTAALLDGDVSQPVVGTPALVGLTMVGNVDTLDERPSADRTWFVGSSSPSGHSVPLLLAHLRLVDLAREADIPVVIDTTGMVHGLEAKTLCLALADAVQPRTVIGLQTTDELEHLLTPLATRGLDVVRLAPSPRAVSKPQSFRAQVRTERFAGYFEKATAHAVRLSRCSIEGSMLGSARPLDDDARQVLHRGLDSFVLEADAAGTGVAVVLASAAHEECAAAIESALGRTGIHVVEASATSGQLVGLAAADGECLGLGILDGWEGDGVVTLFTPLDAGSLATVKRLQFGRLRIGHGGEDFGLAGRERTLTAASTSAVTGG